VPSIDTVPSPAVPVAAAASVLAPKAAPEPTKEVEARTAAIPSQDTAQDVSELPPSIATPAAELPVAAPRAVVEPRSEQDLLVAQAFLGTFLPQLVQRLQPYEESLARCADLETSRQVLATSATDTAQVMLPEPPEPTHIPLAFATWTKPPAGKLHAPVTQQVMRHPVCMAAPLSPSLVQQQWPLGRPRSAAALGAYSHAIDAMRAAQAALAVQPCAGNRIAGLEGNSRHAIEATETSTETVMRNPPLCRMYSSRK